MNKLLKLLCPILAHGHELIVKNMNVHSSLQTRISCENYESTFQLTDTCCNIIRNYVYNDDAMEWMLYVVIIDIRANMLPLPVYPECVSVSDSDSHSDSVRVLSLCLK